VRQALVCGQVGWLAPVENGLRDVRSEVAEADEPREVGLTDPFLLGQCGKRRPAAAHECGVEGVRPNQQLDQPSVGLCGGKRVRLSISILISRPDWCRRTGTDRIWVSSLASSTNGTAGPSKSAPSCVARTWISIWLAPMSMRFTRPASKARWQLQPTLADFRGPRDESALR